MPKAPWKYFRVALVVLAVLIPTTWGAVHFYPRMDDSGLELIVKENGPTAVTAAQSNRPVVGWIVQKGILSPYRRPLGALLQFTGWALLGVVSLALWTQLFPDKRQYAPVAACLTISPILLKGQLGIWFFVVPVNLSVIPAYAAGLLLWRYVRQGSRHAALYLASAALLTFAGGMVSEYGLLSTIAFCILLLSLAWPENRTVRTRLIQSIATLAIAAVGAHLLYARIADPHPSFGGVSVTPGLRQVLAHLPVYGLRFVRAFWYSTTGAYGQAVGNTAAQVEGHSGVLLGVFYAILISVLLAFACRKSGEAEVETDSDSWLRIAALVVAICVGLAPAVLFAPLLVGRDLHMEEMSTRYYFVAAPLAVVLTLRVLFAATRRKWWPVLPLVFGYLAGDAVIRQLHADSRNNQVMHAMGRVLEPYVRGTADQTVVLVPDFYGRDLEMTAKAASAWPADMSRRLWIMWDAREPFVLGGKPADRASSCEDIQTINRNLDTVVRRGKIGNLLWLEPLPHGGFRVEPYCLGPHSLKVD